MKLRNSRKKNIVRFIIVVVIILVAVLLIMHSQDHKPKQPVARTKGATPAQTAIAPSGIEYPSSWTEASQMSTTDERAGVISEAAQESTSTTVIVRKVAEELPKDFNINTLPSQIVASLTKGVGGFHLISDNVIQVQSYNTIQIDYTSTGNANKTLMNEMYIIPTQTNTFYITYTNSKGLISESQSDITNINTSIATYIKTHSY